MFRSIIFSLTLFVTTTSSVFAQQKVNFEKDIWPFFQKKCVECHRAPYEKDGKTKKPKAELRLDGAWAIVLGSENGAVLVPGKADESELHIRVTLPDDDDDFMPPNGKADPFTEDELALFKRWIAEGADFGGWIGSLKGKPKELSNTGAKIPKSAIQEAYERLSKDLKPLAESDWKEVTAAGGRVMPLANGNPLLSVDFRLIGEEATDEKIATLTAISSNVAHLNLSKTSVTDAALDEIGKMKKLVRLDLHQTKITDAGLARLKGLTELRYLNLYGTQISDTGLKQLAALKSLNAVYLWQSKATPKGAKQLQKSLPNAKINIK